MKVLFVGDTPSKRNKSPEIPFVGTKSYKTLLNWIADMDVFIEDIKIVNSTDSRFIVEVLSAITNGNKIIALGKNAEKSLSNLKAKYYLLPHPSGLNRKLNDKEYIKKLLDSCHNYLYM